jgi:hypothetical protein
VGKVMIQNLLQSRCAALGFEANRRLGHTPQPHPSAVEFLGCARQFLASIGGGPIIAAKHTTHIETPLAKATVTSGSLQDSLSGH